MSSPFTPVSIHNDTPEIGVLQIDVFINNTSIIDKYGLISAWVRKEINKIGKAQLVFNAFTQMEYSKDTDSDRNIFTPGNKIRVEIGYEKTTPVKSVFEGYITGQELEINSQREGHLKVECRDYMFPTTMVPKTNIFKDFTDQKLLSTILSAYSELNPTIGSASDKFSEQVQYNTSDWDFILTRAKSNGFYIITEGTKVTIDKPKLTAGSVFTIRFADNLINIKGSLKSSKQISKVNATAWNSKEQKLVTVSVDNVDSNKQGDVSMSELADRMGSNEITMESSEFINESRLKNMITSKLLEIKRQGIQGEVVCNGTADIVSGCVVKLEGMGKHYDGDTYCNAVEHDIKDGIWQTSVSMGITDDQKDINSPDNKSTATDISQIKGLQIGKVAQIDEDPSKENNILVEVPLFKGKDVNKLWARFATFWASDGYGAFFLPDVGDEVVLGFFDADANKPIILGSMYSGKLQPSTKPEKKNNIRSIVTRSKLKLEFEEEKKVITIETPGKNKIELSDDGKYIKLNDQNGNKIEMTDSGISLESSKSITLKAKTEITMEAGTNANIKAKSALNLQSANIEVKADMALTAKGSAKAELSAGGQTIVKGAMVMIN